MTFSKIRNLSLVHGSEITPHNTLIIFDEVQECKEALAALKYFNENAPDYHVASAGSLLGVAISDGRTFPVGKVDFIDLFPLSFLEFLSGTNPQLHDYLQSINQAKPIPDLFFNQLLDYYKSYFISGGMPEAVVVLHEDQDLSAFKLYMLDVGLLRRCSLLSPSAIAEGNRLFTDGCCFHFDLATEMQIPCGNNATCGFMISKYLGIDIVYCIPEADIGNIHPHLKHLVQAAARLDKHGFNVL